MGDKQGAPVSAPHIWGKNTVSHMSDFDFFMYKYPEVTDLLLFRSLRFLIEYLYNTKLRMSVT
jgi:hypothetical protein